MKMENFVESSESSKENFQEGFAVFSGHFSEISKILHDSAMKLYRDGHVVNGFAMTNPVFFKYHIYEDLKKVGAIDEIAEKNAEQTSGQNARKVKLLDLGCGNGCINIISSVLGIDSVGIDNNESMILECQANLKKLDEFHENFKSKNGNGKNENVKSLKLKKAKCDFIHGDFNSEDSFRSSGHEIHDFDIIYSYVEEAQAQSIIKFFRERAHDNSRLILNVGGRRENIEKLAKEYDLKTELKYGEESAYFFFRKR